MKKRFHVYNGNHLVRAIDAENIFVTRPEGMLRFYNGRGHDSESVAAFKDGAWTHYIRIGDIAPATTEEPAA